MSNIFVVNPATRDTYYIDFAAFVELVKGTSIVSLADSDEFLELGLSENLQIRIQAGDDGKLQIAIFSTLNRGEPSSVRVQLVSDDEQPSAALIEDRIRSLRQVYALLVLVDRNQQKNLGANLRRNPTLDIERELLKPEEWLRVEAAGKGTWWMAVVAKAKRAPQAALNTLSLVYGEGRQLLLARVRADTQIRQSTARRETQKAERLLDRRIVDLSKALDKVKDPSARAAIATRLISEMKSINPQLAAPAVRRLLPPKKA